MAIVKCTSAGCQSNATAQFVRVEGRRVSDQRMLCEVHGRDLVQQYRPQSGTYEAKVVACGDTRGIPFDLEALYSEEPTGDGNTHCEIFLLQSRGSIRISVQTGLFELAAIHRALNQMRGSRTATHHAMVALITELGGRLECVTLDKFIADERVYDATLHIRQDNRAVAVNVRPSDAIVLAVICNVRILVSADVLRNSWQETKSN